MSGFGYSRQLTVLDGTSANSSVRTSNPILIADAQQISVSFMTVVTSVGTLTVQGSNSDGFFSALTSATAPDWSTISSVGAQGIFTVTPGARWIRFVRSAIDSQASVVLNYRVY